MDTELEIQVDPVVWTTAAEDAAYFDEQSRKRLHMSGNEFLRRLDAGEWDGVIDDPEHRDVLFLSVVATVVR
jgi:hypothetical protein